MWHATRLGRMDAYLGRQHPDAPMAWRRAVAASEDLLTSSVLERLAHLPGAVALTLLRDAGALPLEPAELLEIHPWPFEAGPDWVWVTERQVVVFATRWGRPGPDALEVDEHLRACAGRWGDRPLVHVGLSPDGPGPTWADLRRQIARGHPTPHVRRVLDELRDLLDARGLARDWLDTLPAVRVRGTVPPLRGARPRPLPPLSDLTVDPKAFGEPWT